MQKIYKLKQWYPGLPVHWKEGIQVFEINNSVGVRGYFSGTDFLRACDVENNPYYWKCVRKEMWSLDEINEAIEKWKFTSKNEELLLVSDLKSEFGI